MIATMPVSETFRTKPESNIHQELQGLPPSVVTAVLRLHAGGGMEDVEAMLPGLISYHLPTGVAPLPEPLPTGLRLREDLGLDSLALSEMAFKLDELFHVPIETREVAGVLTVEDLRNFLGRKLDL